MEQWKVITGFTIYEVSTEGNVRNRNTGKLLVPREDKHGYFKVNLYKNGKQKTRFIHRLVAIAFIPNPHNLPTVNHKNENKHNNHVDNLEWMTQGNNLRHGTRTERATEKIKKRVRCIELDKIFDSITQAEQETGCHNANIVKCCKGKLKSCGGYHWEYV